MCATYPGQVIDLAEMLAVVKSDEHTWRASTVLVPDVAVGDWVIVAAGMILQILDPDEAREIRAMVDEALRDTPVIRAPTADQQEEAKRP
jgi:hydrogenase assembly chaperone HypC/HupF